MNPSPYTAGVDRSPTEVAALYLADHPDGDPVTFLVTLGLTVEDASEAVKLLADAAAVVLPDAVVDPGVPAEDADLPGPGPVVDPGVPADSVKGKGGKSK